MRRSVLALVIIILAAVMVGGGYWYWKVKKGVEKPAEQAIKAVTGGVKIEVQSNPVKGKLPDTNPLNKTNPFKYENPFSQ